MNKKQSQSGSIHLVVTILLSVALIGTLGFVYYQNFIQKNDTSKTDGIKITDNTKSAVPVVAPVTVVNDFMTLFFSCMKSTTPDCSEVSFASQSSALTDAYKESITNPKEKVYKSPIILAQDISEGFTVGAATITGSTATVPVTLDFTPAYKLVYNLVIVGNEWKIDGVSN